MSESAAITHLVLVSIDGGVAHRPSEARHGPGLNITGSTHDRTISRQTGITVLQPEVFCDGMRLRLVFSFIWIFIKNIFLELSKAT